MAGSSRELGPKPLLAKLREQQPSLGTGNKEVREALLALQAEREGQTEGRRQEEEGERRGRDGRADERKRKGAKSRATRGVARKKDGENSKEQRASKARRTCAAASAARAHTARRGTSCERECAVHEHGEVYMYSYAPCTSYA